MKGKVKVKHPGEVVDLVANSILTVKEGRRLLGLKGKKS